MVAYVQGVVASAVAYYVQGLCMRIKGPVFATAFSPLTMIIVAIMASIILSESIFLGRFVFILFYCFTSQIEIDVNCVGK